MMIGYSFYEKLRKRTWKPSRLFMRNRQLVVDMAQNLHLLFVLI